MRLYERVKPISYFKAHANEIMRTLHEAGSPMVVTQNGEARLVVQDIASYEQTQETLALLKVLALGNRQVEQDRIVSASEAFAGIRATNPVDE